MARRAIKPRASLRPEADRRALAIVRGVADSYDRCLVRATARPPIDVALARRQHAAYAAALRSLGFEVIELDADSNYPDCVFVEDAAVVLERRAVGCAPGAPSRRGEVDAVLGAVARFLPVARIEGPATLDGGDVLRIGGELFVGMSARTSAAGIEALARIAARDGLRVVPVRLLGNALHLKSVVTAATDDLLIGVRGEFDSAPFGGREIVYVDPNETPGANVLRAAGTVLVSASAPSLAAELARRAIPTIALDLSEFEKGDGGLTCLSLILSPRDHA